MVLLQLYTSDRLASCMLLLLLTDYPIRGATTADKPHGLTGSLSRQVSHPYGDLLDLLDESRL